MITLTQAFRLCDINEEHITLVDANNPKTSVWGWSEEFKKRLDFSKITVIKIEPSWYLLGDWKGMKFTVKVDTDYRSKVFKYEDFAQMCGYVSASHFNRVFMRYVGMPPGQCRRAYAYDVAGENARIPGSFIGCVLAGKPITQEMLREFEESQ